MPPPGAYARDMLLMRKPWRQASDIRDDFSETWVPGFYRGLEMNAFRLAPKVSVWRAKADTRAIARDREGPTQADVAGQEDYGEGAREYIPAMKPRLNWVRIFPVSDIMESRAAGHLSRQKYHRADSPVMMPLRHGFRRGRPRSAQPGVAMDLRIGRDVGMQVSTPSTPIRGIDFKSIDPQTSRDWVTGRADYKQLRLQKAGVAGFGKLFVIRSLTDLLRNLLGFDGASKVCAPTGVAAFQVAGPAGHRALRAPTGKKAFSQMDPIKGDALRESRENLRQRALLFCDERGVVGRIMMGRKEYRASRAPSDSPRPECVALWGRRPVFNLPWGALHPPVLDAALYDKSARCAAANRGLLAHDCFNEEILLDGISRKGG